jgi:hypothetical protein
MKIFPAKLVVTDPQARRLSDPEVKPRIVHELNGLSSSRRPTTHARSFIDGLPDLGSSNRFILSG